MQWRHPLALRRMQAPRRGLSPAGPATARARTATETQAAMTRSPWLGQGLQPLRLPQLLPQRWSWSWSWSCPKLGLTRRFHWEQGWKHRWLGLSGTRRDRARCRRLRQRRCRLHPWRGRPRRRRHHHRRPSGQSRPAGSRGQSRPALRAHRRHQRRHPGSEGPRSTRIWSGPRETARHQRQGWASTSPTPESQLLAPSAHRQLRAAPPRRPLPRRSRRGWQRLRVGWLRGRPQPRPRLRRRPSPPWQRARLLLLARRPLRGPGLWLPPLPGWESCCPLQGPRPTCRPGLPSSRRRTRGSR
mmetsp:Transcript_1246/g.4889  ORF Transcript_1246/g.4889 Transcript_1246/m.4889 type:complete len:300 (+) Transcript_1246:1819-2718(+)